VLEAKPSKTSLREAGRRGWSTAERIGIGAADNDAKRGKVWGG